MRQVPVRRKTTCSLIRRVTAGNMDFKYFLGIPEIDAQHDEIFALLKTLQEVLSDKEQRQRIPSMLQQLKALLVVHFANEESFMDVIACTEQSAHRMKHKEMLQLLDNCIESLPSRGESEGLGEMINDTLRAHVAEFDTQIVEAVEYLFDTLRTHEVSDKKP